MCKLQKSVPLLLLTIICLSFFGCRTTKVVSEDIPSVPYIIEEKLNFNEKKGPYKYIFFRLYNPDYNNPLYIANFLKAGINITESTHFELSHASINFSLEDNFYGLTLNGECNLERESCNNIQNNEYMIRCNPFTSEQITFALKVTEEEYNATKKMLEEYYETGNVKYHTADNFLMGLFLTKRKYFTKKQNNNLENLDYPRSYIRDKKQQDPEYIENDFVCSTFIAYLLSNNVKEIGDWFDEYDVNYNYINVTDIPYMPGVVILFYSTWDNYDYTVKLFIQQHPEFAEYYYKNRPKVAIKQ